MTGIIVPLCKPFRTSQTGKPVSIGDLSSRTNLQVSYAVAGLAKGTLALTLADLYRKKGIPSSGQHVPIAPFRRRLRGPLLLFAAFYARRDRAARRRIRLLTCTRFWG